MPKIISVHSFRGGTGKSNTTANMAALAAAQGRRVAVVDTDIQSPGIHVLFGSHEHTFLLNDYLWGRCAIEQAAYDVTPAGVHGGCVMLVPASANAADIARIINDGYDMNLLADGFRALIDRLRLDALFIDTHPGLNEETLLTLAVSNTLVVVMRPDHQDYEGTGITVEVARELEVPEILMLVNKNPATYDVDEVKTRVEQAYRLPVAAVIPHSDDLMALGSQSLFVLAHPVHAVTAQYRKLLEMLHL
ncbi:MAG TPA: CDP-3,6-dideoxy-D-glycero-L-glycero-4-hexulose-4-reductase [Verrucomicrobia bacterium]|nr:CDP-3,6-dideoxy-D-glycero-L-glycero-4-hexulose-4-reductase [Verrucomicrobiota bacterium]